MNLEQELTFLRRLARNNNRDWFEKNKQQYLEARAHFEEFVAGLLIEMASFDRSVAGLEPRKMIFRIYRDVRFSKDKRPYKTNMGASISPAGKGIGRPGYYLHIEPGQNSFSAGGLYMPGAPDLAKVRQEIDYNGDELMKILNARDFKRIFGDLWDGDMLKTAPKGYPRDHKYVALLKLRSLLATHNFADKELLQSNVIRKIADTFHILKPFKDFLAEAMS